MKVITSLTDAVFREFPVVVKARGGKPLGLKFEGDGSALSDVPAYMSDSILLGGKEELIGGYERYIAVALKRLYSEGYDFALLLRATTPDQVLRVSRSGLKMPRKSTDFFPKLVAGPVFVK